MKCKFSQRQIQFNCRVRNRLEQESTTLTNTPLAKCCPDGVGVEVEAVKMHRNCVRGKGVWKRAAGVSAAAQHIAESRADATSPSGSCCFCGHSDIFLSLSEEGET